MWQLIKRSAAVAVAGALIVAAVVPAGAQVARPLAAQLDTAADDAVTPVHWRGRGWGWGAGAGFAAGALLGAGIAASRPYYYDPYYGRAYYGPPVVYGAPVYDDAVGYCRRRFKSYDPRSGTYLGYDGYRHPCP